MKSLSNINWVRVFANAGSAFFTTLVGIEISGLTDTVTAIQVAIIPAVINAGLAFCTELKEEAEHLNGCKEENKKIKRRAVRKSIFLLF